MRLPHRSATVLALLVTHLAGWHAPAAAQYVWVDDKGVKQLSDRPPPPSVPAARILKMPRQPAAGAGDVAPAASSAMVPAPASSATPPGPTTTAEREADFQQRRKTAAAAENKAAAAARELAEQAANCNAARQNQRALDGGGSIVNYDANGERSVMNDDQRAELAKNTAKVLASCK